MRISDEFHRWPEWKQRLAAAGSSVVLVVGALAWEAQDTEPKAVLPAPAPVQPEAPRTLLLPEAAPTGRPLKHGRMIDNALEFSSLESLGVGCASRAPGQLGQQQPRLAVGRWPLNLNAGFFLNPAAHDPTKNVIFIGENVDEQGGDEVVSLRRGVALEYSRATGNYNLYTFQVGRSLDQDFGFGTEGDALSTLHRALTLAQLVESPIIYGQLSISVSLDALTPNQALVITATCAP